MVYWHHLDVETMYKILDALPDTFFDMNALDKAVKAYALELSGPIPLISSSHYTRRAMYERFGQKRVDKATAAHWKEKES